MASFMSASGLLLVVVKYEYKCEAGIKGSSSGRSAETMR